jgi:hypothetical protein
MTRRFVFARNLREKAACLRERQAGQFEQRGGSDVRKRGTAK